MIRGTNKRIIEINGEDGSCFERIVLFLKPEQDEVSEERMLRMAEDYADGLLRTHSAVSMLAPRRGRRWDWRKLGALALALLGVCGVIALCVTLL